MLISFNARNDHDRTKFVEDIRESIMEMDEMENLRIEAELERQKSSRTNRYDLLLVLMDLVNREEVILFNMNVHLMRA